MSRSRRALASLAALVVAISGLVAVPAEARSQPTQGIDRELVEALERVDMYEVYLDAATVETALAGLRIDDAGSSEARRAVLDAAAELEEELGDATALVREVDDLRSIYDRTLATARDLRRAVEVDRDPLEVEEAGQVLKELASMRLTTTLSATRRASAALDLALASLRRFVAQASVDSHEATSNNPRRDKQPDTATLDEVLLGLRSLDNQLLGLEFAARVLTPDQRDLRDALAAAITDYHDELRASTGPIDGLPMVTLDAYVAAERFVDEGCSVDWQLLAGIGRIESLHGTLGGASVAPDGDVGPRIFGPLLDGGILEWEAQQAARDAQVEADRIAAEVAAEEARLRAEFEAQQRELYGELYQPTPTPTVENIFGDPPPVEAPPDLWGPPTPTPTPTPDLYGRIPEPVEEPEVEETDIDDEEIEGPLGNGFALIYDTDSGALDGNDRFDRAVGPMQFIPGTWRLFATDGNGDGIADPHNLYDATASAAELLCHLERRNGYAPASTFVLGYNNSSAYVADVLETRDRLRSWTVGSPD